MNQIAENIKGLRRERGMSQEQFARELHVTRQTVSAWERGLSMPGLETLGQIARVLEVEESRVLYGTAAGKKPRYRRVSFWPVLWVLPGWYLGVNLLGMLLSTFLGDGSGDTMILLTTLLLLGMLVVFCCCLLLDEIRNQAYYEKTDAEE